MNVLLFPDLAAHDLAQVQTLECVAASVLDLVLHIIQEKGGVQEFTSAAAASALGMCDLA